MQLNGAMRWFGAFLLGAAMATALVFGVAAFGQARRTDIAAEFGPPVASPKATPPAGPQWVTIEPSHIEVVARRAAPQAEAGASQPSRRRQQG